MSLQTAGVSRNIPFCKLSHFYNLQTLLYVTLNFWRNTLFRFNILKTTKETLLKKFELLRNANREFLSIFILILLHIHVFFFNLSFALLITPITSIRSKCKIAKNSIEN